MKKIIAIIMSVCLMSSMFCITATAEESDSFHIKDSMETETYERYTPQNGVWWGTAETGSMFGDGSLAMLISLAALITSIASICLTVSYNKKNSTSKADSTSDDEEDDK